MSEAASLVATPDETSALEGAGPASDVGDAVEAFTAERPSASEQGAAVTGAALDALGLIDNPLKSLAGAGLGWVIEHVGFLREGLDQLAGDPEQVKAQAQTWHNVALRLHRVAEAERDELAGLTGWQGDAADGYRAEGRRTVETLGGLGDSADLFAGEIMAKAADVATVRSLIRGLLADFVLKVIEWAVAAAVTAAATGGGSVAAFLAGVVGRACQIASKIASMISKLVAALGRTGGAMVKLGARARDLAGALHGSSAVADRAQAYVVEPWKQGAKADRERSEWATRDPWAPARPAPG